MNIKKAYKAIRENCPHLSATVAYEYARRAMVQRVSTQWCVNFTLDSGRKYSYSVHPKSDNPWNPIFTMDGSSRRVRWCQDTGRAGLRFVGYADEISGAGISHIGWFTDEFGHNEKMRGAVWQLPARNGEARYLAGYIDPWNDNAALIDMEIETEENVAARSADGLAEFCAETEREHNRQWQASRDIENMREEIKHARSEHSALIGELRTLVPSLARDTVKRTAARLGVDVAVLVAEIRELFENLPDGKLVD
jgi:hypothetical protein